MSERFEIEIDGKEIWDHVARCYVGAGNTKEHLRILNSHDDLVAALKMLVDIAEGSLPDVFNNDFDAVEYAKAALAKAEGGK